MKERQDVRSCQFSSVAFSVWLLFAYQNRRRLIHFSVPRELLLCLWSRLLSRKFWGNARRTVCSGNRKKTGECKGTVTLKNEDPAVSTALTFSNQKTTRCSVTPKWRNQEANQNASSRTNQRTLKEMNLVWLGGGVIIIIHCRLRAVNWRSGWQILLRAVNDGVAK